MAFFSKNMPLQWLPFLSSTDKDEVANIISSYDFINQMALTFYIPVMILKLLKNYVYWLTILISFFLQVCFSIIKIAKVVPVHKNYSKLDFSNYLPKKLSCICLGQFNIVHEVHTCNACNNLLTYIPRISTRLNMAISPLVLMMHLYGVSSSKIFFKTMIWHPSLNWSHFLWSNSYKLTKIDYKLLTHFWIISSQFPLLNAFYKMQSSY